MKHLLACLVLALLFCTCTVALAEDSEDVFTFRNGIKFGMSMAEVEALCGEDGLELDVVEDGYTKDGYEAIGYAPWELVFDAPVTVMGQEFARLAFSFSLSDELKSISCISFTRMDFGAIKDALMTKYGSCQLEVVEFPYPYVELDEVLAFWFHGTLVDWILLSSEDYGSLSFHWSQEVFADDFTQIYNLENKLFFDTFSFRMTLEQIRSKATELGWANNFVQWGLPYEPNDEPIYSVALGGQRDTFVVFSSDQSNDKLFTKMQIVFDGITPSSFKWPLLQALKEHFDQIFGESIQVSSEYDPPEIEYFEGGYSETRAYDKWEYALLGMKVTLESMGGSLVISFEAVDLTAQPIHKPTSRGVGLPCRRKSGFEIC